MCEQTCFRASDSHIWTADSSKLEKHEEVEGQIVQCAQQPQFPQAEHPADELSLAGTAGGCPEQKPLHRHTACKNGHPTSAEGMCWLCRAVHWWQLHTEVIFYRLVQLRKLQALFLTLRFRCLQFFFQPVLCWSLPSPTDTWKIQQVKGEEFFFSSFSKTVNTSMTLFAQKTLNTKILLSFPSQLLEHLISLVKWMLQRK